MIITVTLNPAVDKTVVVDCFRQGSVNRAVSVREDAGGKGINVSKLIKSLEGESTVTGVIGGYTGSFIRSQLDGMGIKNDFVEIEGNTRTNIKLVDKGNGIYTDINEPGAEIPTEALRQVADKIFGTLKERDIIVLSGSVPRNVDKGIYGSWIEAANAAGAATILDADGELLEKGIAAAPYLVKPNIEELEGLFGKKARNADEAAGLAVRLLEYGIGVAAVSMGEHGSIFASKEKTIIVKAPKVEVKSTVGAGDSMVGAIAYGISRGWPMEEYARLAAAAAAASVSNEGTVMGTAEQTRFWMDKIEII